MENNIQKLIRNKNIEFAIVPNSLLKDLITKNEHPHIVKIPDSYKLAFLMAGDGKAINIDRELIEKYVNGDIDEGQKFILDRCDIRVIGDWLTAVKAQKNTV